MFYVNMFETFLTPLHAVFLLYDADLENDACVTPCTSDNQLKVSSNTLKLLMEDLNKVQKLSSLTTTKPDTQKPQRANI